MRAGLNFTEMELKDFKDEVARENKYENWDKFAEEIVWQGNYPFREHDEAAERYAQHRYLVGQKTGARNNEDARYRHPKPFISREEGAELRRGITRADIVDLTPEGWEHREGFHFQIDTQEARKISSDFRSMSDKEIISVLDFSEFRCSLVGSCPILRPVNPWIGIKNQNENVRLFELYAAVNTFIFPEGELDGIYKRFFMNVAYRYAPMPSESEDDWRYCTLQEYLEKSEHNNYQCQKIYIKKK